MFNSDNQMNRVLEFHLVNPHGGVVPLSVILAHILADAGARLFNNGQLRIIGDRQVCRFPPDHSSAPEFQIQRR